MAVEIDKDLCTGCGDCVRVCQSFALFQDEIGNPDERVIPQVEKSLCSDCGTCVGFCTKEAISFLIPVRDNLG